MTSRMFIEPGSSVCGVEVRSKKHCLEVLSELFARSGCNIPGDEIFAKLIERERLGSTALDHGIAFPHCRMEGISDCYGALLKLAGPIEFDSPDGSPVDLVFGLMVPVELTEEHQRDIAELTRYLNDAGLQARLREATSDRALYEAFVSGQRDGHGAAAARNAPNATHG